MTPRRALLAPLTAALIALSGCTAEAPGGSPATTTPGTGTLGSAPPTTPPAATPAPGPATPPVEDLPASWKLCQNPSRGSSMGYPGGWFTTSLSPSAACSLFHPSAFTIPVNSEFPLVALNAAQSDLSVAAYVAQATDPAFVTTTRNEATTVLGRSARRFEVTSLGEGLDEAGTRRYGYAIDRGGRAFVVYTVARPGESRYNDWKSVVDTAKGTIRFL